MRLLDYVVGRVVDSARQIRKEQHPAVRGTFDGEFTWPVLLPGAIYHAAFPDRGRPVATAEIGSLAAFGFPQAVIDAWAGDIPRLNQLQLDAINEFGTLMFPPLIKVFSFRNPSEWRPVFRAEKAHQSQGERRKPEFIADP